MTRYEEIINELLDIADNPDLAIKSWKETTGKPIAGLLPEYTPEEIVYAAGMIPAGLWGGSTKITKARAYIQPFACSIMQSILEYQLQGSYDLLDVAIIPTLCDTLKCIGQKWKANCPVIQITYPQNRAIEAANLYLESEYQMVRNKLEKLLNMEITDKEIENSIEIYNQNRNAVLTFTEVANHHLDIIMPRVRHGIIKSRFFMDKKDHTEKLNELVKELNALADVQWKGTKVILTGITAEPNEILDIMAELGMAVVGDDLVQESKQVRTLVPEGGRPLYRLAKQWQNLEGCSLAGDFKKIRGHKLIQMAEEKEADAVIVCMMKFCDPEEFDYAIYHKELDEKEIKHIVIEIDQEATSFEQIRTRLQSLAEMC